MSEEQDINPWYRPIEEWTNWECQNFVKWIAATYDGQSLGSMAQVLEGYRAVRDVEASVQETVTYKATERYATGWTDARGVFGK